MTADNLSHAELSRAVLAEVSDLAAGNGWPRVTEFTRSLAAAGDRTIAVAAAPETDPEPLTAWIRGLGEPVSVTPSGLEPVYGNPALALTANRVVVALRCGHLLMPETVEAAAAIAQRPARSYMIVLTGAEDIHTPEDLDAVERGIWRVLLGRPGGERRDQDIASRHCLLWSAATPDGWLSGRVARDVASLREWVTGPPGVPGELARDRALCAVWLAMSAAGESAKADLPAGPAMDVVQVAGLAADVRGLHARLLGRLAADAGITGCQVTASLASLKQDLLCAMSPGQEVPAGFVKQAVHEWERETARMLMERRKAADEQVGELLDRVDWRMVNELAPHPAGDTYPRAFLWHLMPQAANLSAGDWRRVAAQVPDSAGPDWARALRSGSGAALVTAGLGAAALAFLGMPLLPVAGAAAAGALGGSLYNRHRADVEDRNARQAARKEIDIAAENATTSARKVLGEQAEAVRAAVDEEFRKLEEALDAKADAAARRGSAVPGARGEDVPGAQLKARLRELRDQLVA